MKIIKPSVEFFGAIPTDYTNALRFIEMAGRTCYKSEDKITADSAEGFVKRLIKAGHLAMVEHSNFVVKGNMDYHPDFKYRLMHLAGKYLSVIWENGTFYVGGNLTAWFQGYDSIAPLWEPFRKVYGELFNVSPQNDTYAWEVCPHNEIPPALHRYSAKFICDRGVSHELVRHRPCSFAQESTRYVSYNDKDMEFIEPTGFEGWDALTREDFLHGCGNSANSYANMIQGDLRPQQARAVLPNALKTEVVVTADAAEWVHIKKLRAHPSAHPDMVRVMNMIPWEDFL